MARAMRIIVDGHEIGRIGNNRREQFPVPPGSHTVQVAMDWCRSLPLQVDLDPEQTVELRIEVPNTFSMDTFIGVFFWPGRVFGLKRATSLQ